MIKILVFWDIYGRVWRHGLAKELEVLKKTYQPDFIIANVDNATSGRGIIEKHLKELSALWIDVFTWWDHVLDNIHKITEYIEKENSNLIRPANFQSTWDYKIPGKWYKIIEKNGKKLAIIHLLGQAFMPMQLNNPFTEVDDILSQLSEEKLDGIMIDFHKETTAEWYGMAFFLDGKVSGIFWTHTHVQTNDEIIFQGGTGFISDIGMCGPLYSVIWAHYPSVKKRFLTWINKWKLEQSLDANYVVSWAVFTLWDDMKCQHIEKIRIIGK